jgi:translocation and assembly module TamB
VTARGVLRRVRKIVLWMLGIAIALPVVLVAAVLVLLNTDFGRAQVEQRLPGLTGDMVRISGLSGRFPDALRVAHVEVRDAQGAWIAIDDLALDWSPLKLVSGVARIDRLAASRFAMPRLPVSSPTPADAQPSSGGGFSLPVTVDLGALHADRAEVGAPVAGADVVATIDGDAHVVSLYDNGHVHLAIRRIDAPGTYVADAALDPAHVDVTLHVDEPQGGFVARLGGIDAIGAIVADAKLVGPRDAIASHVTLAAGPLTAGIDGTVDLTHSAADLHVVAHAPAMQPRPDIGWQSVAIDLQARGPFTAPDAAGTVRIERLAAAGASVGAIAADVKGNAGHVALTATLDALRIPGPKPDLLAAAPLRIAAQAELAGAAQQVTAHLTHPLIDLAAKASLGAARDVTATLTLPDLAPLAAAGGVDLQGRTVLDVTAHQAGDAVTATVSGTLGVTGGMAPVPALVGDGAKLDLAVALHGSDVTLDHLKLDGRTLNLDTKGTFAGGVLAADYRVALTDLAVLAPTVAGKLTVSGHAAGPQTDLAVEAHVDAEVAAKGVQSGPLTADISAHGLPGAPAGTVTAKGAFDGAPIDLALAATRAADGAMHLGIDKVSWKSLNVAGALDLPAGQKLPIGTVTVAFGRLDDLRAISGLPLGGSVNAKLETSAQQARLTLDARNAGLAGKASVTDAKIDATVRDPLGHPSVVATARAEGISAGAIAGRVELTARGPQEALALKLDAALRNLAGADATVATALTVNATAKDATVATLQATWKGQTARLLAPVRVNFASGVSVDRLRIGLGTAVLDVAGRASPTLDLTARLTNVTAEMARPFAPDLPADGTLNAEARLTGAPAHPTGTVRVDATGLHLRNGSARAIPPATLNATANLAGTSARVDVKFNAGPRIAMTAGGTAPLGAGPIDMRAQGRIDLAVLDPFLLANGERVRGIMTLDLNIGGTAAAPRPTGSVTLAGGEVQDFTQGAHLTDIAVRLDAAGETIRLTSLSAKAGPGTIAAQGSVGVAGDMPIDMTLTLRHARPLSSDRLTADIDGDLKLVGTLASKVTASGKLLIARADVRVPEKLPTSVVTLNVRNPRAPPPTTPRTAATPLTIALDVALSAQRVFVRGRGLDVELGGDMHVRGTTANPIPDGGFQMRRGDLSLAGQTLTFTKGDVSFNGGALTDPSLNFVASTTNGTTTANLVIGGTASNPKISLNSTPDLPQDEILAQILFHRSASQLSPIELAQAAAALASFTGATGGSDPLDSVRQGLGLDRLSVGSDAAGNPAVTAGRYVAPGVFVGAKQSASGGTQATVQVDLYRGLKLEGTAGTSSGTATGSSTTGQTQSNGSGVGVTYGFEY